VSVMSDYAAVGDRRTAPQRLAATREAETANAGLLRRNEGSRSSPRDIVGRTRECRASG
jgi:hypothetical protein